MKRTIKKVTGALLFIAVFSVGILGGASNIWGLEQAGTLAKQIQGSWTLVSIYNELDGKKTDVFGTDPKGTLILTPNGQYALIITKQALPKFVANNRVRGTAEENQAVVQGSVAYFGSYAVASEKDNVVNMKIDGCTFPNWVGDTQKRVMIVKGDEMSLTNPVAAIGGTNHLIWKRVN